MPCLQTSLRMKTKIIIVYYIVFGLSRTKHTCAHCLLLVQMQGYSIHLGATFSEWLMAFSFLGYFLTFIIEFRHFRFLCILRRTNDVELFLDDIPDVAASDDDSRLLR
jgi:hypothetical protein